MSGSDTGRSLPAARGEAFFYVRPTRTRAVRASLHSRSAGLAAARQIAAPSLRHRRSHEPY